MNGRSQAGVAGSWTRLSEQHTREYDHRLMELESPFTGLAAMLQEGNWVGVLGVCPTSMVNGCRARVLTQGSCPRPVLLPVG